MEIKIVIPGIPIPKQSFRFGLMKTKTGIPIVRKYQPKEIVNQKNHIIARLKALLPYDYQPSENPLIIHECTFYFPFRKSSKDYEGKPKTTKPDVTDNLLKGLIDAMQGIVFVNDSQIWKMVNVRKVYSENPRTEITIGDE